MIENMSILNKYAFVFYSIFSSYLLYRKTYLACVPLSRFYFPFCTTFAERKPKKAIVI